VTNDLPLKAKDPEDEVQVRNALEEADAIVLTQAELELWEVRDWPWQTEESAH